MRLCFLGDAFSIHIQRWLQFFAKRGHDVHLISFDEYIIPNIKLHLIHPPPMKISLLKTLIASWETGKLIREINPDIVHAHFVTSYGLLGAISNVHPLIITAMGSDILRFPKESKIYEWIAAYVLKKADLITCDSEKVMREIVSYCSDQGKVFIIQWGVDLDTFKKLDYHSNKRVFTILSTRSFEILYNIDIIIESIPYVIKKFPNAKFILKNGYGTRELQLKELSKQYGVMQNIEIVNQIVEYNEMPKFLNNADIFISVPSSDSSSISLQEAMACKLPVVVSDLPANREWINDGWNGYIVPVRDPKSLADAIVKLLENKEQRELFGKRNREIIIERADHEKHMLRMEELYRSLLIKSQPG